MSVQPGMRWRYLILSLVSGALVLNGVYLLAHLGQSLSYNPPPRAWLWVLLVVLTSPLQAAGEEFLFRGYLLQSFGALFRNRWLALGGSALLFALVHGQQNVWLFVDRLGFGLLAGALVLWTGGLEAGIGLHVANNVSSFCYAIAAGTVVQTRQVQYADVRTVLLDLAGYAIAGALAWWIGRHMRVAVRTP
jgi:membrane protease YdiL (CAAX protease family)